MLQLFIQCFHISSLKITICTSGTISLVEVHFCGDQNWHFWRKSDCLQLFLWRPKPDLFLHIKSDHLQFCGTKTSFFPGKLDQLQMFLWEPNFTFLHRKSVYLQRFLWRPNLAFFTACPTNSRCFCGNQICLFWMKSVYLQLFLWRPNLSFSTGGWTASFKETWGHFQPFLWWPKTVVIGSMVFWMLSQVILKIYLFKFCSKACRIIYKQVLFAAHPPM